MWVCTLLCWEQTGNLIAEYARCGLKKCIHLIVRGYKHQEQFVSFLQPLSFSSFENLRKRMVWLGLWQQQVLGAGLSRQERRLQLRSTFALTTERVSWGACHPRGWTHTCSAQSCSWQWAGLCIVGKSVLTQIRGRYKKQENWTTWNNSRALPLNV